MSWISLPLPTNEAHITNSHYDDIENMTVQGEEINMHDFKVIKVGKQSGGKSGEKNSQEYDGSLYYLRASLGFQIRWLLVSLVAPTKNLYENCDETIGN